MNQHNASPSTAYDPCERKITHDRVKQSRKTLFKTVAIEERDWIQLPLKHKAGEFVSAGMRSWKSSGGL